MEASRHPIRLVSHDDLERSRLTVFFRLVLAIPHLLWILVWGVAVALVTVVNWFITLSQGRTPAGIHDFVAGYLRYVTHVKGYIYLGANPYPDFGDMANRGAAYPIDLEIDPPAPQNRWKTGFRIILALPTLLIGAALGSARFGIGTAYDYVSVGVLTVAAVLGWFAIMARGQMPRGLSQLVAYCVSYSAQVTAYILLLTDRYPDCDPHAVALPAVAPPRAVRLRADEELVRSRLTTFFRLFLAIPHFVWLLLWGLVNLGALIANWFVTLFTGRPSDGLHGFIGRYIRYTVHLYSYVLLVANPYPPFGGRPGTYPVDLEIDPPQPQNRWRTGFRIVLVIPAALLGSALSSAATACGVLGWFAVLATGRMPRMLRNLALFALAYGAERNGYLSLLTERYPYSGPVFAPEPEPLAPEPPQPAMQP